MSKFSFLESFLIGQASFFGLVLACSPILFLYRKEIIGNIQHYGELAAYEREIREAKEKAEKALQLLDDYSFKIFLPCKSSGTGWILDFEIPEPGHYPTKWYIATNAHVANKFRFINSDYEKELPTKELTEKAKNPSFPNFALSDKRSCELSKINPNYFDFNLSKQKNGEEFGSNYGAIYSNKMKEPKLFYAPIDFLNTDYAKGVIKNNYKDFAVIEVEFTSEGYAKEATDDFYGKYEERKERKPIDVLASPWEKEKYRGNSEVRLYSLGYEDSKKFKYTFSYEEEIGLTSKLAKNKAPSDSEGRVSTLLFDGGKLKVKWNEKPLHRVGHFYLIDHFAMGAGVSGGLVIDEDGDVWAIRSITSWQVDQSLVVPLRSKEIRNRTIKTSQYDLILGGSPNQKSSYKQRVEEHILKKNKETWLSQRGEWKEALQKE